MILKIDLKDPKFCNECPCLDFSLNDLDLPGAAFCNIGNKFLKVVNRNPESFKIIRPPKCIEENGE